MTMQIHEWEMRIKRKVHYNKDTGWGAYGCEPVHPNLELKKSYFRNISLRGKSRMLEEGESYTVKFEGAYKDDKYGYVYEILEVKAEKLETIQQQDKFLRNILPKSQFDSLKNAYPDSKLVDLIMTDRVDISLTKGIKEASIEGIKSKVIEWEGSAVLLELTETMEMSEGAIRKIENHYGDPQLAVERIRENIYSLCEIKMFGFAKVDSYAMKRGDSRTSDYRIESCFVHLIEVAMKGGHSWIQRGSLLEGAVKLLDVPHDFLSERLQLILKGDTIQTSFDNRISLVSVYKQEMSLYENLIRIQEAYIAPDSTSLNDRIKLLEDKQGFEFTSEQRFAITQGFSQGVMVVNGKAGSGKSFLVEGLIKTMGNLEFISCALSGKASQVLSQRGVKSATIHRMLGRNKETGGFLYNEGNPLPYDVIVIDESSMINVSLLHSVIKAVPDGAKVIIVGDSGQLPAIGFGDALRDLLGTQRFPCYELTEVHRQAAKSGILTLANKIREGIQIMPYNSSGREVYGELLDQTVISYAGKGGISDDIIRIAQEYKKKLTKPQDIVDFQVLVANRDRGELSVENMNIQLQKVFNDMKKPFVKHFVYEYRTDDKIIHKGNSYDTPIYRSVDDYRAYKSHSPKSLLKEGLISIEDVFNGTMGIIIALEKGEKGEDVIVVEFEGIEGYVAISRSNLESIRMAYTLSIHESQGSGIRHIIFALDYGAFSLLSRQLAYTAITRAVEKGVVLCENNAMFTAISKDASGDRRTFLGDFMSNY